MEKEKKHNKTPATKSWDEWFAAEGVTEDFLTERDQPPDQKRESLE